MGLLTSMIPCAGRSCRQASGAADRSRPHSPGGAHVCVLLPSVQRIPVAYPVQAIIVVQKYKLQGREFSRTTRRYCSSLRRIEGAHTAARDLS